MESLVSKLPYLAIVWFLYSHWVLWTEREERLFNKKSTIPIIKTKIAKKLKEKKQLKDYFKDLEDAKAKIELAAKQIEKAQAKLPNSIDDAEVLATIRAMADELSIKNVFLSQTIEENKGFYYAKRYRLKGSGTFLQFLILFQKISFNNRLLNIKVVNLSKTKEKQRGRFQVINCEAIIEAYRYNSRHKEDRGFAKIEKEFAIKKKKDSKSKKKRRKRKIPRKK